MAGKHIINAAPRIRVSPLVFPVLLAAANYLPARDALGFAAAVAAHEAGHLLAIKLQGRRIFSFSVSPFGCVIESSLSSYKNDALCAAAGPAASFLFAAATALFRSFSRAMPTAFYISLLLGMFNLLPVGGLDGGAILSSILSHRSGLPPPRAAERYVNAAALFALFLISCFLFLYTGNNPTMLLLCLGMMMKNGRT